MNDLIAKMLNDKMFSTEMLTAKMLGAEHLTAKMSEISNKNIVAYNMLCKPPEVLKHQRVTGFPCL